MIKTAHMLLWVWWPKKLMDDKKDLQMSTLPVVLLANKKCEKQTKNFIIGYEEKYFT